MYLTRTHAVVLLAILAGWGVTLAGTLSGWRSGLGHDHIIHSGLPILEGAILFLVGWQVMVAAMMLPSSLGAVRSFHGLAGVSVAPHRLAGAFLAGYAAVWTVVGAVALGGDTFVHTLTHRWAWLSLHPWVIAAGALTVAGWFELSRWSARCRNSEAMDADDARPGSVDARQALRFGAAHGLTRLRECWPIMLLSFAFGMTSLLWMVGLTLLMTLERSARWAPRVALIAGVALVTAAVLVVVEPARVVPMLLGLI